MYKLTLFSLIYSNLRMFYVGMGFDFVLSIFNVDVERQTRRYIQRIRKSLNRETRDSLLRN